jgi:hypothetical protein
MLIVLKSESLNLLEPSGTVQACNGIALPLPFTSHYARQQLWHTAVYAHSRESSLTAGTGHVLRWHTWWNHKVGEAMRYLNCINCKVCSISCRPTYENWYDVNLNWNIQPYCQNYFTFRCEMVHCPFKDKWIFVVHFLLGNSPGT